ncbi:MAG: hypothetical protein SVV80_11570 [Planctomycetota bacterium]|nr:hypothetical protein [Planctomycetota bacterium]
MRTSITGNRAFTIVELVVVVVVIVVLTTMIMLRMPGATGSARLRASSRRLLVAAQYARDFAVTHRCFCLLVINQNERQYGLMYQEDPEHRPGELIRLQTGVGKTDRLEDGIRFGNVWIEPSLQRDGISPQRNCITFDPSGRSDAAVVQITGGRRTYSMLVVPGSGRARLVEKAVNELPNDRRDLDE